MDKLEKELSVGDTVVFGGVTVRCVENVDQDGLCCKECAMISFVCSEVACMNTSRQDKKHVHFEVVNNG